MWTSVLQIAAGLDRSGNMEDFEGKVLCLEVLLIEAEVKTAVFWESWDGRGHRW